MEVEDAKRIAYRLFLHIQEDQYEACYDILRKEESMFTDRARAQQERRDGLECIANLPIDLRWIALLERQGYLYLSDLDGVDISKLSVRQLGVKGKQAICEAVKEAREQLAEEKRDEQA